MTAAEICLEAQQRSTGNGLHLRIRSLAERMKIRGYCWSEMMKPAGLSSDNGLVSSLSERPSTEPKNPATMSVRQPRTLLYVGKEGADVTIYAEDILFKQVALSAIRFLRIPAMFRGLTARTLNCAA